MDETEKNHNLCSKKSKTVQNWVTEFWTKRFLSFFFEAATFGLINNRENTPPFLVRN